MLSVRNLRAGYGRIPILHGISFDVADGEYVGILGHNGMGKTTLLKTLIGLIKATDGTIELDGEDVTREPANKRSRRGMGYVAQGREIFPNLTVLDNMRLGFAVKKVDEDAVLEEVLSEFPRLKPLLERIGLADSAARHVGQLAHGERQWVELGIALTADPALILLDEPTAGMTAEEVDRTTALIGEINKSAALIVVEHDMQFIKRIAHKVTVFHQGAILVEDSMDNLLNNQRVRDIYLGKQAAREC